MSSLFTSIVMESDNASANLRYEIARRATTLTVGHSRPTIAVLSDQSAPASSQALLFDWATDALKTYAAIAILIDPKNAHAAKDNLATEAVVQVRITIADIGGANPVVLPVIDVRRTLGLIIPSTFRSSITAAAVDRQLQEVSVRNNKLAGYGSIVVEMHNWL